MSNRHSGAHIYGVALILVPVIWSNASLVTLGGPMRITLSIMLLMLPFSVSAQTPQGEQPSVSRFRVCVRSHASDARAAGVRTLDDAANYFIKVCLPLFGIFLGPNDALKEEALPPGIYRSVLREEWRDFTESGNGR